VLRTLEIIVRLPASLIRAVKFGTSSELVILAVIADTRRIDPWLPKLRDETSPIGGINETWCWPSTLEARLSFQAINANERRLLLQVQLP